ncbi:epimerase [Paenibacillus sp. FSL R7-0345]|uniref:epimerase n=1 Tax=Paenibacillus sp. FSL R7-0345 TaxID=2954535 RepID=UPI00315A39B5
MDGSENMNTFGELLINQVRDRTIEQWEKVLTGQIKSKRAVSVYEEARLKLDSPALEMVTGLVSQIVDSTLHNFLSLCEQEEKIKILFKTYDIEKAEETNIVEISDGLAGELYTEDGWILKYSKKPYIEP